MGGASDGRPNDDSAPPEERTEDAPERGEADDAIDASLHMALSDLERMLDGHEGAATRRGGARPSSPADTDEDGEQYTIPLLDEVAIPGPSQSVPPQTAASAQSEPVPLADDEPSVRARIATRIASEIDVIVQDRIEEALQSVSDEIRRRVRDHMDIILPEIVEELVQARKRDRRS